MIVAHAGAAGLEVAAALGLGVPAIALSRPGRRRVAALVAVATLLIAASPQLAHASETATTPHMVQHLLVVAVAAPLLGFSFARLGGSTGQDSRHGSVRWLRSDATALLLRHPAAPLLWAALHVATLTVAHAPQVYRLALGSLPWHLVQHAVFMIGALGLWTSVCWHAGRRRSLVALAAVSAIGVAGAGLGALLTFMGEPLTPTATLLDQQLAGVLMWSIGGAVSMVAGAGVVLAGLCRAERAGGAPVDGLVGQLR